LRHTEQQVGQRRAGGRSSAYGAAGPRLLGEKAGEGVGTGDVAGVAKEVVMNAVEIAAKADVVLLVDPGVDSVAAMVWLSWKFGCCSLKCW
jgi:hypothetical protein